MKIGIDPGLGGAIAFVGDKMIKIFDTPIMEVPWVTASKYHRMVDTQKLYGLIKNCPHPIESITIELVSAKSDQGISSTVAFMGAFYSVLAVARMFMEPQLVRPQKWKKNFGLINMPKDASRLVVLQMYPELLPQLKRKKDVDRAEALMIAVSGE